MSGPKFAVSDWTFRGQWAFSQFAAETGHAGLTGIELNVDESPGSYLSPSSAPRDAILLAAKARDAGVSIASLSTTLFQQYPYNHPDVSVRRMALQLARKMLELGAAAGAETILVLPGSLAPEIRYDRAYAMAQEALLTLAEEARSVGVKIGVENVRDNKFLWSPLEFSRFIDEIGRPSLGVYLDIGNVIPVGFPEHWISLLGSRIVAVHAKDMLELPDAPAITVPFHEGNVNWTKVRQAIFEIGYEGAVTATPPPADGELEQLLKNNVRELKRIFTADKSCV